MKKILKIGSSVAGILATLGSIVIFFPALSAEEGTLTLWHIVWGVVLLLVCAALIANSVVEAVDKRQRHHVFDSESAEFRRFFANWYAKPGKLSIICDDLDWTKNGEDVRIYDQLLQKSRSKELLLLLGRGLSSPLVKTLERSGAVARPGPGNIISQLSFSCISVMGNAAGQAIVRNKRTDHANRIAFDEVQDTYVIELLNALINV